MGHGLSQARSCHTSTHAGVIGKVVSLGEACALESVVNERALRWLSLSVLITVVAIVVLTSLAIYIWLKHLYEELADAQPRFVQLRVRIGPRRSRYRTPSATSNARAVVGRWRELRE